MKQHILIEVPKGEAALIECTDAAGDKLECWGLDFYITDEDLEKGADHLRHKYFDVAASYILEKLKKEKEQR